MNIIALSFAYLRYRFWNSFFNIMLLGLGIATITIVLLLSRHLEDRLDKDAAGIDLVVGAKGSPLQLILSSVYHVDIPTGNIALSEAQTLMHHPQVKLAIPLALGDNYQGFRIVGTEPIFTSLYASALAAGRLWHKSMEVVIGADVATSANMNIGNLFAGSHGLIPGGNTHADHQYVVVGIMPKTGTVMDRLILTSVDSVWDIHEEEEHQERAEMASHQHKHTMLETVSPQHEITALLIKYRSPVAAMTLPRIINQRTQMQAASPAFEVTRLFHVLGIGKEVLKAMGYGLMAFSLLSVWVALTNTMRERRYDIALMRVLGASRMRVSVQMIVEALLLVVSGVVLGQLIARIGLCVMAFWLRDVQYGLPLLYPLQIEEIWLNLALVVTAVMAALYPAIQSYRVEVASLLRRT
ncbi:MAG: ABC transporter permease [Alphaproteobacteria bacterium]|nr:ABC transporter permease [Alphaproteobacteria bacterium]